MLRRVALPRIEVSEERRATIISVTRMCELGTTLAVTSNRSTLRKNTNINTNVVPSSPILVILMMEMLGSTETSVLTRSTRCIIPEDGIFHSHRREDLKPYITVIVYFYLANKNYKEKSVFSVLTVGYERQREQ
jgi:hypothetical protein